MQFTFLHEQDVVSQQVMAQAAHTRTASVAQHGRMHALRELLSSPGSRLLRPITAFQLTAPAGTLGSPAGAEGQRHTHVISYSYDCA